MVGAINLRSRTMIRHDPRLIHRACAFVAPKLSVRRIEDQRVTDLMMGDRIEVVLLAAEIARPPPVVIARREVPAERVEVSFDFNLDAAGTFQRPGAAAARLEAPGEGRLTT